MKSYVVGVLLVSTLLLSCGVRNSEEEHQVPSLSDPFEASLEKAEATANLNVFITLNKKAENVSKPKGKLSGIIIAVKDNIHVAGLSNTAGTAAMANFVPKQDAPIIKRLKAEGAMVIGKTNMHELAFGITSNNAHFGAVKNPYDHNRFPGGSSGGSAAAVALRIVPAAIGTDTGGSMRIPASLTGVIGFRASVGRYPSEGLTPISHTRDVPGPMALNMEMITLLDSVMAGGEQVTQVADLKTLRLGVARNPFFQNLDPETRLQTERALAVLRSAGVTLVEADINGLSDLTEKTSFPIVLYEVNQSLESYLEINHIGKTYFEMAAEIESPDVKGLFTGLAADKDGDGHPDGLIPKAVYDEALGVHRETMIALYQAYFEKHQVDALVFPTTILSAGLIEGTEEFVVHNGEKVPTMMTYIQNTDPGSTAGLPGISLPTGLTKDGLPVGLALDALPGNDEKLLAIANALEPIFPPLDPPQN